MNLKRSIKMLAIAVGLLTCLAGTNQDLSAQTGINVYPAVDGLAASEYYAFSVQEVSNLDTSESDQDSNWLQPFAWFTKCIDHVDGVDTAYYDEFMGSWSHTYCNFEMAENTPIVVKITRLNKLGAPAGPITSAVARPARSVESCEIINGDVYVTMNNPAMVAIDIDGQMEGRNAPLNIEQFAWGPREIHSPFTNEMDATHAVTIFANPFLQNKPDPADPSVKVVEPGDPMPADDGSWSTLYFMPGVHKMSVDEDGNERPWHPDDVYKINSNRNYYIPGDAIVYGNFHDKDWLGVTQENVRLFGHGTLSGEKIDHFKDWSSSLDGTDHSLLRVCQIASAKNCVVEGITVANQAEHGIYFYAANEIYQPNYIKWVKMISWRENNDSLHVNGNSYIEDCFLRHQDDAIYVDAMAVRRVIMWSDVNGAPLRNSFLLSSRKNDYPAALPQNLIIEDIDILYSRSYFGGAIISASGPAANETYSDGTINTGQHVVYRNIRVLDPRPQRVLFDFNITGDQNATFSGLKFQDVHFEASNIYGHTIKFLGNETSGINFWQLDNVTIGGEEIDQDYIDDPEKTEINEHATDFDFSSLFIEPEFLRGDCNLDGVVNFSDIPSFIGIISVSNYLAEADINGDGAVSFLDIGPFIALLSE